MKKWVFKLASILGPTVEKYNFSLINMTFRTAISFLFLPLLKTYLRLTTGCDSSFSLQTRHSINEKNRYNFLFSDVDLSIIVSENDVTKSDLISKKHASIKNIFLNLGELEIYTAAEMRNIQNLMTKVQPDFQFLRDFRKIGWVEDENRTFPSEYHKIKYYRGLRNLLRKFKYSGEIKDFSNISLVVPELEHWLSELQIPKLVFPKIEFLEFSNYLGFTVTNTALPQSAPRTVTLEDHLGFVFLSIIPHQSANPTLQSILDAYRAHPKVKNLWHCLLELEIDILNGVYRARPGIFPQMPLWIEQLKSYRTVEYAK